MLSIAAFRQNVCLFCLKASQGVDGHQHWIFKWGGPTCPGTLKDLMVTFWRNLVWLCFSHWIHSMFWLVFWQVRQLRDLLPPEEACSMGPYTTHGIDQSRCLVPIENNEKTDRDKTEPCPLPTFLLPCCDVAFSLIDCLMPSPIEASVSAQELSESQM